MRSRLRRKFERARAVLAFHARYPHQADPGRAAEARLRESIAEEEAITTRGRVAAEEGDRLATEREELAQALVGGLELLIGFLRAVAAGEGRGEVARRAIRLRRDAVGSFLREGREALTLASAELPALVRYGMPPGMVEVLTRQLGLAEEVHRRRLECGEVLARVAADLAAVADRQAVLLRQLDALNRYRFVAAPGPLAEWRAAMGLPQDGEEERSGPGEAGAECAP